MTVIIHSIITRWRDSGVICKSEEDIYEYGLELILFSILNLVAILLTALFLGKFLESVLLIITIIPLQMLGGGYHAKTHLRCFLVMYIGWWAIIFLIPLISPLIALIVNCVSVTIVFLLAPIPHVNIKMSARQRYRLRKLVRIIVFTFSVFGSALTRSDSIGLSVGIVISTGIGVAALSMLIAYISNKHVMLEQS